MTIKFEILAASPLELFQQIEELLKGKSGQPMPSVFEAVVEDDQDPKTIAARIEARERARINELQAQVNAAPAQPGVKPEDKPKKAPAKKKATNGKTTKVKPLPEDDDPLATDDDYEEDSDLPEETESEDFDPPAVDEQLIAAATDKLRDLFKTNAKGVAGVRALREKYKVTYFHQVPVDQAKDLWSDALKLEAEMAASA